MDVAAEVGFRRSPFWLIVLILLVVGQGWLTLRLFGPGLPIDRLMSDEPILDGKHPLHAYHGLLGNRVWHERRATTCYDPAFQAGYLKTPIFDAASRPAELFYLVGGPFPASYKIGLVICCLLAPLAFALAARGIGMGAGGACLAGLLGGALWWSSPCRSLLESGDIDLLVGGICVPVYLCWLARYGRAPGPVEWMILAASAAVGWYMHPILMLGAVPLAVIYHLWLFRSVRFAWHLGLLSANIAGLGANAFWLGDWIKHVWMFVPYGGEDVPHVYWPASVQDWEAFLPHDPVDLVVGAIGMVGFLAMLRRVPNAAVLLIAGTVLFVSAGGAGRLWPVVAEFGAEKVLSVGVWCSAIPCAFALTAIAGRLGESSGFRPLGFLWLVIGLGGLAYGLDLPRRFEVNPLALGLGADREAIVRLIRERSSPDGRILWEDRADTSPGAGWTALLPELTQRPFLGGLSQDVPTDYLHARLADGKLVNRPVAEWTDDELSRFCDRYNVARVVCRTPDSIARFRRFPGATEVAQFEDAAAVMFSLDRRTSFVLKGRATITQMDWKRVALSNLEPDENGVIVLSLHYHANWRVTPGYATMEKDVDVTDPVPMIRLRLPGPVARLTMTWKGE